MKILQLKVSRLLLLLLLLSTPLPTWAESQEDCNTTTKITNYFELENATITSNLANKEALFHTFFSPNLPSPKSVEIHYWVDRCGSTEPYRILEDDNCGNIEIWFWMSSAVYFIIDPFVLDRHALHILSWFPPFNEQLQPKLNLTIPPIQDDKAFNLLQQLTMTVSNMHVAYNTYVRGTASLANQSSYMHIHYRWTLFFPFTAQGVCQKQHSEK